MGQHSQRLDVPLLTSRERILHLAFLAPGEIIGGAERQILTLSQTLASDGRAAPILILFHDRELADQARRLQIPVRTLGARGLVDLGSLWRLRQILLEEQIDAISLHGYRATVYLALALRKMWLPVVKTEHGALESTGDSLIGSWRPYLYRWLENAAVRWLGAHIAYVTDELQNHCATEHRGLARSVIYNGVTRLDRTATCRPTEFSSTDMNLVAVGRLDRVKGLDVAVRALARSEMPNQVRLYLIGSGAEQDSLAQLARKLGISSHVSFIGFRNNAYDYIAHADALLMPSRHEGLPYTLLEALSLGTPVIASRVGGLAEVLTDRKTALLIEPGNVTELAQAVQTLASAPDLRQQLISNGRELVAEKFTAEEMARQYRSLFESITPAEAAR